MATKRHSGTTTVTDDNLQVLVSFIVPFGATDPAGSTPNRLFINTTSNRVKFHNGTAWITLPIAADVTGFANPMTTAGDLIYGGASGVATRRAIGSTGQVLTVVSGLPAWATPAAGGVTSVFTRTGAVVAASGDYSSFYPLLNGTGATGTWGIAITGNAGTVTNGVYTSGSYSNPSWITALAWSKITGTPTTISGYGITDFNSLGDARYAQLAANNIFTGDNSLNNKTLAVYATGTVADAMGAIGVTMPADANNYAMFGLTRYTGTAIGIGMNTSNDLIFGSGTARGIGAVITAVTFRHNPGSGSTSILNSSGTTLWDLNPSGNVVATGSITASSIVKSGGTGSQYLMADGSTTIGTSGVISNTVSAQTTAQTILSHAVGASDTVFDASGLVTISSASSLVLNLNLSYTDENSNAVSYNFLVNLGANGQYGSSVRTIKAKAGTNIVISTNFTGTCTYNSDVYVRPLFTTPSP